MNLEEEILLNQFAQGICSSDRLLSQFKSLNIENKRKMIREIGNLIFQSKSNIDDIDKAISNSKLKPTFTPCVIIMKGLNHGNFEKIINLPENELVKAFKLFIYLFKEGYLRRYLEEKDNSNKWWYWDLSNHANLKKIRKGLI